MVVSSSLRYSSFKKPGDKNSQNYIEINSFLPIIYIGTDCEVIVVLATPRKDRGTHLSRTAFLWRSGFFGKWAISSKGSFSPTRRLFRLVPTDMLFCLVISLRRFAPCSCIYNFYRKIISAASPENLHECVAKLYTTKSTTKGRHIYM